MGQEARRCVEVVSNAPGVSGAMPHQEEVHRSRRRHAGENPPPQGRTERKGKVKENPTQEKEEKEEK